MSLLALLSALALDAALQTTGLAEATPEIYQPPATRPFQPPSMFGREEAEGDAVDLHRRPLTDPVAVGAYAGDYEFDTTEGQIAYDRGVDRARRDAEAAMGPLDGRWRIVQADGTPLLSLALTDRGEQRRVEGAWLRLDAAAGTEPMGAAGPVSRDGDVVVIPLSRGELRLRSSASGWAGALIENGRARTVTATRIG